MRSALGAPGPASMHQLIFKDLCSIFRCPPGPKLCVPRVDQHIGLTVGHTYQKIIMLAWLFKFGVHSTVHVGVLLRFKLCGIMTTLTSASFQLLSTLDHRIFAEQKIWKVNLFFWEGGVGVILLIFNTTRLL